MTQTPPSYAVFLDARRHSCIRVTVDRKYTTFIPFNAKELKLCRLTHEEFNERYTLAPDYPVDRAARLYLGMDGVRVEAVGEAKAHLAALAGPAYERADLSQDPEPDIPPSTPGKEPEMSTATEAPVKRKPAAKAPPPTPKAAAKAAKTPKGEKSAKAAKPAKAAEGGTRGRAPNFSGTSKIKVLTKENPKRAAAAERFALYKNGMTVDEYIAAGGKRADVNWDVKQGFIEVK